MELRRFLPYRNLQTRNLGLLLVTARVVAWIALLWIAFGIAAAVSGILGSRLMGVVLAGYALGVLAVSGVLAALVGIEEAQRRLGERD